MKFKWTGLCVHHSAGTQNETVDSIRAYHKSKGYADCAYHFVMQRDSNGKWHLKRGRPDTMQGCHGVTSYNRTYLGFVVPGNYSKTKMDEELYQAVLGAVKHIMQLYGLKKLVGHREIKATECPGNLFPLNRLKMDCEIL